MEGDRITHRGAAYGVGEAPDRYGVWDLRAGGDPVASFERTPEGWAAAWARFQELERRFGRPRWRSEGWGWIALHILIALALWFAALVAGIGILIGLGRDTDEATTMTVGGVFLALAPALAAWFLFVYLPARRAARASLLAGLLLAAVAVVVVFGVLGQPAA